MSIADLLTGVDEAIKTKVIAAYESEKSTMQEALDNKGREVKKWMTAANTLKDKMKGVDLDPDGDIAGQLEAMIKKPGNPNDLEAAIKKALKPVEAKLAEVEADRAAQKAKAERYSKSKLDQALSEKLGDKVVTKDSLKLMIYEGKVKLADDDSVVWVDGDNETTLDKGVEAWIKANPDKVKTQQQNGSGGKQNTGTKQNDKTITRTAFETLAPADKMATIKAGTSITD